MTIVHCESVGRSVAGEAGRHGAGFARQRSAMACPGFRVRAMLPLLLLGACQSAQQRADDHARQAQTEMDAGHPYLAERSIQLALGLRDDNPNYFMLLGNIELKLGKTSSAYNAFNRGLDLDTANVALLSYVANLALQTGHVQQASDISDRLLNIDPSSIAALRVKAMIALARQKDDDAVAFAKKIQDISPSDEVGVVVQARVMAKQGKLEDALTLLDQASLTTGDTIAILMNKANIYRMMNEPRKVVPLLAKVTSEFAQPAVHLDEINLLYKLGDVDKARQAAVALLVSGAGTLSDYLVLRRIWSDYDPRPILAADIKTVAQLKDPLAITAVVRYLLLQGDVASARAILDATPAKMADQLAALKARVLARSGQGKLARKRVEALLDKDRNNVDALILRAQFEQQEGKTNLAINDLQTAMVAEPSDVEPYLILADIYRGDDEKERARRVYREGWQQLPQSFALLEHHMQFLHGLGDKAQAVSTAREFARDLPSSVKAWRILAAQCSWAGDTQCGQIAARGLAEAKMSYNLDGLPGAASGRSLLGPI